MDPSRLAHMDCTTAKDAYNGVAQLCKADMRPARVDSNVWERWRVRGGTEVT